MQVRIPVVPKLDHIEKRLQDGLILIISPRSSQGHEWLSVPGDSAGGVGEPGARGWSQLWGACDIDPELLPPHVNADPGVSKNNGAPYPTAARCAVEYISRAVDN